ncbi:MAG: TonB-dependent receptor [Bacteroidales bacterium]|nr:TonB-dependent receptor [Bacteroidales bacterium]
MRTHENRALFSKALLRATTCLFLAGSAGISPALAVTGETAPGVEAVQQNVAVSGTVKDVNGEPIIGASVVVKGTTNGTITDFDGNFTLEASAKGTLVVSYIGYKTQEVVINGQRSLNITLKEDTEVLDEVVVVGYGTQKKATLTGSVSSIGGEDLKKVSTANLTNTLAGKTAGVIANTRSGEPGADDATILIRGKGTTGDTSPLIVVDGIADRSFGRLNPEDIESISVLKDASAAIYGARAANGVILVTTKRGKEGKVKVNYSGNVSFSQPTRVPEMLNAYQYATYVNEFDAAQGNALTYPETAIAKILDGSDQINYPDTNWWKEVARNWATNTEHSLSVSGGNEKMSFYTSAQYMYQDVIYKNSPQNYNQYQFSTNLDAHITKAIHFSFDILGRQAVDSRGVYTTEDLFGYFLTTSPMAAPYYPNGLLRIGHDGMTNNAVLMVSDIPGTSKSTYNTLNLKPKVRIDLDVITPGLYVEGYAAMDYSFNRNKTQRAPYDIYSYKADTDEYVNQREGTGAVSVGTWQSTSSNITLNARIGYSHLFEGGHKVDAFVAYEQCKYDYEYLYGYRTNFISSALPDLDFGSTDKKDQSNGGNSNETARQNWFGRINYGYKDRYLAEVTLRYDGSMNFAPGHRWGLFPAFSAGWVVSEENFFEPLRDAVSFLKLKGSWGMMGNDAISAYQYLSMYGFNGSQHAVFGTSYTPVQGIYETVTANPLVTWETAKTWNIGLSTQFLGGKFGLDIDYFQSNRSDILATRNASVPTYSGLSLPAENIGKVKNSGFETVLSYHDRKGDFEYGVTGNVTYAKNKVVYMDEAVNTPEWQRTTGHPIDGAIYYVATGIYQTQEEIDATPHLWGTKVGDLIYQDTNGDGNITWDDAVRRDKSATPKWIFGLTLNGSWKGFDVNAFFQGQADAEILVQPTMNMATEFYEGRWCESNTAEQNAAAKWPRAFMKESQVDGRNSYSSTWWLRDASFVRLKSLEVGYTFPKQTLSSIGLEALRLYVNGNNLFTIDSVGLFDPEMTNGVKGYSLQRTWTVGVNVTF